jgi:hypothetical protein
VIHRDVKPENMLLGEKNEILLSDFGIAVVTQTSRSSQDINGTVAYMAPEQLQGKAQPASDQYALAVVAYELLSGDVPFKGSFAEVGSQHLFAPLPPLREKLPTIDADVEVVLQTALSKEPQKRFATIQAFANALEQAALSSDVMTEMGNSNTSRPTALSSTGQYQPLTPPPPPGMQPILTPQPAGNPMPGYPPVPPQDPEQFRATQMSATRPSGPQGSLQHPNPTRAGQGTEAATTMQSPPQPSGYPGQFAPTSPGPKPEERPKRNPLVPVLIGLVVLLLLVTTSSVIYAFAWQGKLPWAANNATASPTQLANQGTVAPTPTATTEPTTEVTATTTVESTPTAQATVPSSDKVYNENVKDLELICTDGCQVPLKIILKSITFDLSAQQMNWNYQVTNTGNTSCDAQGSLTLTGPNGDTLNGFYGSFSSSTALQAGQSLPLSLTVHYNLPKKNVPYIVATKAQCNYSDKNFRTEQFVFTTGG